MEDNNLINRLNKHPHIKARLEVLLNVAENSSGEFERADDAEAALIDGIRQMGQELLQGWATNQNMAMELKTRDNNDLKRHAKKNFTGDLPSGKLK